MQRETQSIQLQRSPEISNLVKLQGRRRRYNSRPHLETRQAVIQVKEVIPPKQPHHHRVKERLFKSHLNHRVSRRRNSRPRLETRKTRHQHLLVNLYVSISSCGGSGFSSSCGCGYASGNGSGSDIVVVVYSLW